MNWKKVLVGIVAVLLAALQLVYMVLERGVCQEEGAICPAAPAVDHKEVK